MTRVSIPHHKICYVEPGLYRPGFRAYRAATPSQIMMLPEDTQAWAKIQYGGRESYKRVGEIVEQNLAMPREQLLDDIYHEAVVLKALDRPVFENSEILQASYMGNLDLA